MTLLIYFATTEASAPLHLHQHLLLFNKERRSILFVDKENHLLVPALPLRWEKIPVTHAWYRVAAEYASKAHVLKG